MKAAAQSFRANPAFDTKQVLMELGTGEALVSVLDEKGIPGVVQRCAILPPQSLMGAISDEEKKKAYLANNLYLRYREMYDRDSAYEFLARQNAQLAQEREQQRRAEAEAKEAEKQKAAEEKAAAKAAEQKAKAAEREKAKKEKAVKSSIKSVGNSVMGTVGREVGKNLGGAVGGSFGKRLGGNLGASLARSILGTFLKG